MVKNNIPTLSKIEINKNKHSKDITTLEKMNPLNGLLTSKIQKKKEKKETKNRN